MLCTLHTPYLLQDDSLSVEPVGYCSCVLYLGGHHKAQCSQLSDLHHHDHQTVTVEFLQRAILVTQLHQVGNGLETANGLLSEQGGKHCTTQTISLLNAASSLKQTSNNYITPSTTQTT